MNWSSIIVRGIRCLSAAAIVFSVGCDDPAANVPPPPPPAAAKPEPPRAARPTTQSLADGKWKRVPISALPMSITVPDSWEPQAIGGQRLFLMEGYTPSGHVSLTLASRSQLAHDKVADFISVARKKMDEKGDQKLHVDTREYPDFTVLERQWMDGRTTMLLRNDAGELVEREAQPVNWSYLIFLKGVDTVDVYELEFDDLTLEIYKQDREFLERILKSLTNEGSLRN